MKKQKEEFKSAIDALQEHVTNLEHAHDDLEKYGRRLSVRVEDTPIATDETVECYRKSREHFKRAMSRFIWQCY